MLAGLDDIDHGVGVTPAITYEIKPPIPTISRM